MAKYRVLLLRVRQQVVCVDVEARSVGQARTRARGEARRGVVALNAVGEEQMVFRAEDAWKLNDTPNPKEGVPDAADPRD